MFLQFDLLFWPDCLQIFGPKSGEILKLTPLIRVNFRETAFNINRGFYIPSVTNEGIFYNDPFCFVWVSGSLG